MSPSSTARSIKPGCNPRQAPDRPGRHALCRPAPDAHPSAGQQQRNGRKSPPRLRRTASARCTSLPGRLATRSALAGFRSAAIPISPRGSDPGGAIRIRPVRVSAEIKSCNSAGANRIFVSAEKPFFIIQTVSCHSPRRGRIALSANKRIAEFLDFAIQAKFAYVNKLLHHFPIPKQKA